MTSNPGIKVLVGLPGSSTAAGMGYVEGEQLQQMLAYSKTFDSFGGVMSWYALLPFETFGRASGSIRLSYRLEGNR